MVKDVIPPKYLILCWLWLNSGVCGVSVILIWWMRRLVQGLAPGSSYLPIIVSKPPSEPGAELGSQPRLLSSGLLLPFCYCVLFYYLLLSRNAPSALSAAFPPSILLWWEVAERPSRQSAWRKGLEFLHASYVFCGQLGFFHENTYCSFSWNKPKVLPSAKCFLSLGQVATSPTFHSVMLTDALSASCPVLSSLQTAPFFGVSWP